MLNGTKDDANNLDQSQEKLVDYLIDHDIEFDKVKEAIKDHYEAFIRQHGIEAFSDFYDQHKK